MELNESQKPEFMSDMEKSSPDPMNIVHEIENGVACYQVSKLSNMNDRG